MCYKDIPKKNQTNPNLEIDKYGGQTTLPALVEQTLVANIIKCAEWGYPVIEFEVRMFVKYHLDQIGCTVRKFKDNRPGIDWAKSFLQRHRLSCSTNVPKHQKKSSCC